MNKELEDNNFILKFKNFFRFTNFDIKQMWIIENYQEIVDTM